MAPRRGYASGMFDSASRPLVVACFVASLAAQAEPIVFRKVVVDAKFRSEGIAAADVDRDGDRDLLVGDFWYEAPAWTPHRLRKGPDLGDGARSWSECFACFADDLDGDGFPDQIVVGFPGKRGLWYRNPGQAGGEWAMHEFAPSVSNESPQWVDLLGKGQKGLLCGTQPTGEICWLTPGKDPTKAWDRVVLSAPQAPGSAQFAHGLGCGDVDGDGRADVFVPQGFWTQPEQSAAGPWPFTKAALGADCAQMYAFDADGDGRRDVVSSSAHARGIWWHRQQQDAAGLRTFATGDVHTAITQTHALEVGDVDGDGRLDLITGKRWWAHGPDGDEDPKGTPYLLWIGNEAAAEPGAAPRWTPHVIDDASGVGTQFAVVDLDGDGRLDVATSNKRGVFVFLQQPRAAR